MNKANVAEWILRRVVNSERASELVGDRLEVSSGKGALRFWAYIAWIVFVFSWRTLAGLVAAVVFGLSFAFYLPAFAWERLNFSELSPLARVTWANIALQSTLLWGEAGFCIVRFGLRNDLSKFSVIAAMLSSIAAGCGWLPHASAILLLAAGCIVLFYLTNAMRRQSLGVWVLAVMSAWMTVYALIRVQWTFSKSPPYIALIAVPAVLGGVSLSLLRRSSAFVSVGLD